MNNHSLIKTTINLSTLFIITDHSGGPSFWGPWGAHLSGPWEPRRLWTVGFWRFCRATIWRSTEDDSHTSSTQTGNHWNQKYHTKCRYKRFCLHVYCFRSCSSTGKFGLTTTACQPEFSHRATNLQLKYISIMSLCIRISYFSLFFP